MGVPSSLTDTVAKNAALSTQPFRIAKKISVSFWQLRLIGNRPDPFAERRKPNLKIRSNLTPCPAAGERDANRIPLELITVCRSHIQSQS